MIKKYRMIAIITISAACMLLSSCRPSSPGGKFYARFVPDESKIVSMSIPSIYSGAEQIYFSVYDHVGAGEKLLKFDTRNRQETIKELESYKSLYQSYMELNDINIEMSDQNIEYNTDKYDQLKQNYGTRPSSSQQAELNLMLKQIELYKKTQEENKKSREINETEYNDYSRSLEQYSAMGDYFMTPIDGYLLTLALARSEESGNLDIGTMIPAKDVLLEIDFKSSFALQIDRIIQVRISGQWVDMSVYKNTDHVYLKFVDLQQTDLINFMNPLLVEVSIDQSGT